MTGPTCRGLEIVRQVDRLRHALRVSWARYEVRTVRLSFDDWVAVAEMLNPIGELRLSAVGAIKVNGVRLEATATLQPGELAPVLVAASP